VKPMASITTDRTIDKLTLIFADLPEQQISDNGPQFTSDEFSRDSRERMESDVPWSSISPCLKWGSRKISPYCERCFGETGVTGSWKHDDEAQAC